MVRVGIKVVEVSKGHFEIVKERGESTGATEIEKAIAASVEHALQIRIDEIMDEAKKAGAETSREVRRG